MQMIEFVEGIFVGTTAAHFSESLARELATRSWLLARLYQRLGYVGRCSFDMLLTGDDIANCRIEFLECNGRWGGTSLPMTLMNRIFSDWARRPFAVKVVQAEGLDRLEFSDLRERLGARLYDARTGRGWLVLYNAGRMKHQSAINAVVLGRTWEEAGETIDHLPPMIRELIAAPP